MIASAKERLAYCIRERMRFEKTMDIDDAAAQRTWAKLDRDVKLAASDLDLLSGGISNPDGVSRGGACPLRSGPAALRHEH